MPTMYDVAREAGVSQTTVSFVLNRDKRSERITAATQEKVFAAARKLEYSPNLIARSLSTGKSFRISLAVGKPNELTFARVVGFEEYFREHGYTVDLVFARQEINGSWSPVLEAIVQGNPAGVAFFSCEPDFVVPTVARVSKLAKPHIAIDINQPGIDALLIDREVGFYQATRYLIEQGRQRIAYLGRPSYRRTIEPYERALQDAGLSPIHLFSPPEIEVADMFTFAQSAAKHFVGAQHPDAAICHNDDTALGLLSGLHRLGMCVPDDVAVFGFDNVKAASMSYPALSTIGQPQEEAGRLAAEILLHKINGETPPPEGWANTLPVSLIHRETA